MIKSSYWIIGVCFSGGIFSAWGESFLQSASFPKTFADLPFTVRMDVLSEGYNSLETVYDENGRCVSGCAYAGITIEKEIDMIERNTKLANSIIEQEKQSGTSERITNSGQIINQPTLSNEPDIISNVTDKSTVSYTCSQYRKAKSTKVPLNSPIDGHIYISSDFGPRQQPIKGKTSSFHKGIDISVPIGTPIYATADGVIEYIQENMENGGKYIVVKHANNFRTAYFHLSNNRIMKTGDTVQAGCLIGISGNTGPSTGPHLHYAIYYTEPGKKFGWSTDAIDPLWTTNYLGTDYKFKYQKSCLHNPRNFCSASSKTPESIPTDPLPGEIK